MNTYINQSIIYSSLHGKIHTIRQSGKYPNISAGGISGGLTFIPSTSGVSGTYNPHDYSQTTSSIEMYFDDCVQYGNDEYNYGTQAKTYYTISPDTGYVIDKVYMHSMTDNGVETLTELTPSQYNNKEYFYASDMHYNYNYQLLNVMFKPILVSSIQIYTPLVNIYVGETWQHDVNISPSNALNKIVKWTSDDDTIATVDDNGLMTAVSVGEVNIHATSIDGSNITNSTHVKVAEDPAGAIILPTGLAFNQAIKTAYVGDTFKIMPTFTPLDVTDKTLTWACSQGIDESYVMVGLSGLVTASQVINNVTISATTTNGIVATYQLNVYSNKITLNKTSMTVALEESPQMLSAILTNSSGEEFEGECEWSSSDDDIATVINAGEVVLKAEGTVDITASYGSGSSYCEAICTITIVKPIVIPGFELSPEIIAEAKAADPDFNEDDFKLPTIAFIGGIAFLLDMDAILLAFKEGIIKACKFTKEQISKMVEKFGDNLHYIFMSIGKTLSAIGKKLTSLDINPRELFNNIMSYAKDSSLIAQLKAMVEQAKGYINNIKYHAATIATPITAFPSITAILAALSPLMIILQALGLIALALAPLAPFIIALVAAIKAVNKALDPVYSAPVVGSLFPKLVVTE